MILIRQIHYSCHCKRWAVKSRLFGAKMPLQAPKGLDLQGPPLPMALEINLAPYFLPRINNRYIKGSVSKKVGGSGVTSTLGTWYGGVVMCV